MIELFVEGAPYGIEHVVVDEPAGLLVDRSAHGDLDFEAVPVQARALVARGHLRETVRRFEPQLFDETYVHDAGTLAATPAEARGSLRGVQVAPEAGPPARLP